MLINTYKLASFSYQVLVSVYETIPNDQQVTEESFMLLDAQQHLKETNKNKNKNNPSHSVASILLYKVWFGSEV